MLMSMQILTAIVPKDGVKLERIWKQLLQIPPPDASDLGICYTIYKWEG